jgi:GTP-binding protein
VKISSAVYITSSPKLESCPPPDKPEYAFIGRSNVGKSSLINMLCGFQGLARISSKPGKTQIINHYLINEKWYLVDLPGYGYAKVSKDKRAIFEKMINGYIIGRKNLMCVFVLIDARIEPQELDLAFMGNLAERGIPFAMAFTKCDKLSVNNLPKKIAAYKKRMLEEWEEFPQYFLTSAETKTGRQEILNFIGETNQIFSQLMS